MVRPGLVMIAFGPCLRADFDKIAVALIIFRKQNQMGQFFFYALRLFEAAAPRQINFTSR